MMAPEERASVVAAEVESAWVESGDWCGEELVARITAAIRAAVAEERERCANVAHGLYMAEGPPVAPLGSHLAMRRAAGAEIALRIRCGSAHVGGGSIRVTEGGGG